MRTLVPSLVEVFQNLNHRGVGYSNVEMNFYLAILEVHCAVNNQKLTAYTH